MQYNLAKRLNKYRKIRACLYWYLKAWRKKTDNLNCFYYASLHQLKTLNYVINYIKHPEIGFGVDSEDWRYIKSMGNAKVVRFGEYTTQL